MKNRAVREERDSLVWKEECVRQECAARRTLKKRKYQKTNEVRRKGDIYLG
jgi:hypothetical protein